VKQHHMVDGHAFCLSSVLLSLAAGGWLHLLPSCMGSGTSSHIDIPAGSGYEARYLTTQ
jgi:hypothetical protein